MKTSKFLLLTTYLLLQSSLSLFAQNIPAYDLTFYTPHYRFHCITGEGLSISKNDFTQKYLKQVKDSIVGSVCKSKEDGYDSIIINYPFKEKIDSVVLNIVDGTIKYQVSSLDLIFLHKQSEPKVISCNGNINSESWGLFKNDKTGDEIIFRNIHALDPYGSLRSFAPLSITIH